MMNLPQRIENVKQLEELLSRPSKSLIEYVKRLEGDIMILGAGGKIGPTMVMRAKRAIEEAKAAKEVFAVDVQPLDSLKKQGIKTIKCNMLDWKEVNELPRVKNIVYMIGRKFGSSGSEWLTWAVNVMIPHNVADVFRESRISQFSTGCVYPVVDVYTGGSVETDPANPVGEYAVSCLGRERMFDYYAAEKGEKVVQVRLNYALELRYGVLVDIATKVYNGEEVDVTTGFMNGIWQGDCCDQVLRSFDLASSPASILNVTGPEILSIRWVANRFGELFSKEVKITGQENGRAYLNNATKANAIFGNPSVPIGKIIEWVADWIQRGGENSGKPTHFETQNGKY
ncbi:MAG: NAD-dependent epimerase/dehydratase family protein [Phycisphaerales bacterium]